MKLLVACKGSGRGDFFWTNEDEIVMPGFVCCSGDSCGCNRSLVGVETRKATTTFKVVDRPDVDFNGLVKIFGNSWRKAGFDMSDNDLPAVVQRIRDFCKDLPVGTIAETDRSPYSYRVRRGEKQS